MPDAMSYRVCVACSSADVTKSSHVCAGTNTAPCGCGCLHSAQACHAFEQDKLRRYNGPRAEAVARYQAQMRADGPPPPLAGT